MPGTAVGPPGMVRRDPETGKFVSDGSSTETGFTYDDLEIQSVHTKVNMGQDEGAGGSTLEQVNTIEPSDGLSRGEAAELVAAVINVGLNPRITDVTDPAWARFHWETTADPEYHHGASETVTDYDGNTGIDVSRGDQLDPDDLWHYYVGFHSAFSDSTNGYGGGADGSGGRTIELAFRDRFGQGPIYDRHDTLYWHVNENSSGSAAGESVEEATLYWLIRDADRC